MKILFTTHHLNNYAGSELVIFDLAKHFQNLNYDVTIATFSFGYPIKSLYEKENLKVVNVLEYQLETKVFDIIWAQHAPVLYHVLLKQKVIANVIIYSSLSPFEPLETPPIFINDLSLCLSNSEENKQELLSLGVDPEKIMVFINSVPDYYFNFYDSSKKPNIVNIALISNHVPAELYEAISMLSKSGMKVTTFGIENKFELITPELLTGYDAVITIGRTVQQCMSLGIPVYCYDRFGGPGWLTHDNLKRAQFYNFSGRCCNRKITAKSIFDEITGYFDSAFNERHYFYSVAKEHYSLSDNVQKVLQFIDKTKIDPTVFLSYKILERHNDYYIREKTERAIVVSNFQEMVRNLEEMLNEKNKIINQKEEIISQKEAVISQQEEIISQQEEIISQQEEIISQQESVLNQKEEILNKIYNSNVLKILKKYYRFKRQLFDKRR